MVIILADELLQCAGICRSLQIEQFRSMWQEEPADLLLEVHLLCTSCRRSLEGVTEVQ